MGGFVPAVLRLEVTLKGQELSVNRLKTKTYHPKPGDYEVAMATIDAQTRDHILA